MALAAAIGLMLGLGIYALGRWLALERDRSFYPTVLVVIASYYVLFAAMTGDGAAVAIELALTLPFVAAALLGIVSGVVWPAAGILLHGVFDLVHSQLLPNHGSPIWWPVFCGTIDICLGLAVLYSWNQQRRIMA